jgi:hypothetical protein
MDGQGLFVAALFGAGFTTFLVLAFRWRRRAPKLAAAAALWATIAYAVPGLLAFLPPSRIDSAVHESQP